MMMLNTRKDIILQRSHILKWVCLAVFLRLGEAFTKPSTTTSTGRVTFQHNRVRAKDSYNNDECRHLCVPSPQIASPNIRTNSRRLASIDKCYDTSLSLVSRNGDVGYGNEVGHVISKKNIGPIRNLLRRASSTLFETKSGSDFEGSGQEDDSDDSAEMSMDLLDTILSRLTSAFPLFVLSSAVLGTFFPPSLNWVNSGKNTISFMLAAVMWGTGLTLSKKDFTDILFGDKDSSSSTSSSSSWTVVPLGVLCQFIIMPVAAGIIGRSLLLSSSHGMTASTLESAKAIFLGLCLVGCAPGGTASNLVSLIAQADVALSVLLTSCSTMLAVIATPLLVGLLVQSQVQVSGLALCQATARVVLLPVVAGMFVKAKAPRLANLVSRFAPFGSVVLVALICGGVVAQNASLVQSTIASGVGSGLLVRMGLSILLLHTIGFAAGYAIPKWIFGEKEKRARTISIEVGMQNSALAVVLAQSIGAPPLAALPGAISATTHSCLGSILAAFWRLRVPKDEDATSSTTKKEKAADGLYKVTLTDEDDPPEFAI